MSGRPVTCRLPVKAGRVITRHRSAATRRAGRRRVRSVAAPGGSSVAEGEDQGGLVALALAAHPVGGAADQIARQQQVAVVLEHGLGARRSEEHTSELQSLMRISYAVFCLKKKKTNTSTSYADRTSTEQRHT